MTAAPAVVTGLGSNLSSWLGAGGTGDAPAAAPLLWTVAAFSRSELGGAGRTVKPAASTTSGEPVGPGAASKVAPLVGPAASGNLVAPAAAPMPR